jgi:hypothetical protein
MKKVFGALLTALLSLILSLSVNGGIYKWTDENGIIHFTGELSKVKKGGKMEERNVSIAPLGIFLLKCFLLLAKH